MCWRLEYICNVCYGRDQIGGVDNTNNGEVIRLQCPTSLRLHSGRLCPILRQIWLDHICYHCCARKQGDTTQVFRAWVADHKRAMDNIRRKLAQEPLDYTPITADVAPALQVVGPGVLGYRDGVTTTRHGVMIPPNGFGNQVHIVYDSRTGRYISGDGWPRKYWDINSRRV